MIAPIFSNSFATESSPVAQNPRQSFSTALQQAQSNQFSSGPASPTQLQGGTPAQHLVGGSTNSSQHAHRHHHASAGSETDDNSDNVTSSPFGQLGQPVQAATASTTQATGSLQQDLQQVALNSDLLNAQSAFLQDSVLSVSA
jgi:hypothetical protein